MRKAWNIKHLAQYFLFATHEAFVMHLFKVNSRHGERRWITTDQQRRRRQRQRSRTARIPIAWATVYRRQTTSCGIGRKCSQVYLLLIAVPLVRC